MISPIVILATCLSLISVTSAQKSAELTLEEFGNSLTQSISKSHDTNWFISPASIASALGMVYLGAEGNTKMEIGNVLGVTSDTSAATDQIYDLQKNLQSNKSSNVIWNIANKILVNKGIELIPQYQSDVKNKFHSEIESVDFSTDVISAVNSWVKQKTNGFIENIVSPGDFDSLTKLVLMNAVYFKGMWKFQFNSGMTKKDCFYTKNNQCNKIDMMYQSNRFKYIDSKELEAQVIELPYSDEDYSMVIVLPRKRDGLDQVIEKLKSHSPFKTLISAPKPNVNLHLPKFEYEFKLNLKDTLMKLGVVTPFANADLTKMIKGSYQIDKVIHKAKVSVFEEGTIAAAATAIGVHYNLPMINNDIYFTVNGPFLFFIKKQNIILFSGQKVSFS